MGKNENGNDTAISGDEAVRVFGLKTANEWLDAARQKPIPKMLFGEFWFEGELSIMFADTGKGKSILAVQIAEAIARGVSIGPIKTTSGPQRVLYLDCELTEKQFEIRYAGDAEEGDEVLKDHYEFSNNFFRAQVDPATDKPDGYESTEEYFYDALAKLAERSGAKVLVVDNISFLQRSNEHSGAALALMRRLKRMKSELDLSILVLAHTPKRAASKPLTINDLAGFKTLSNFADNIFAIGQSRIESDIRYIKHLKQRSSEVLCDERNVPSFRIAKHGGNFLSFEFLRYTTEAAHLFNYKDSITLKRAALVRKLSAAGMTQRTIAGEMGISLGAVNKYLHMEYLTEGNTKTAAVFDLGSKLAVFPGCEKIDRQIAAKIKEHKSETNSATRQDLEYDLEVLGLERDLAQRKYWVASGKITGDAVEKALMIGAPRRKPSPDLFIETPLPGHRGFKGYPAQG